jgi:hypothetical protein
MRIRVERSLRFGLLIAGLAGCTTAPVEPRVEYREVKVAVAAGCVSGAPETVKPLNERIPADQWNALAPGAKAEAVKAQAGERMNYEDQLRAATAACPPVK